MTAGRAALALLLLAALVAGGLWVRQRWQPPVAAGPPAHSGAAQSPQPAPKSDPQPGGKQPATPPADPAEPPAEPPAADPNAPQPVDPPAPAEPPAEPPWAETLQWAPQPHAAIRYRRMDAPAQLLGAEDLKQWLEPFAGRGQSIGSQGTRRGATATFKGAYRLRCPWPDQAVLRIGAENVAAHNFRIHVFDELEGVMFLHTASSMTPKWTAYVTRRSDHRSLPDVRQLAADDAHRDDRQRRHDDGPLELHWRDGFVRLVSGERTLVAAPLKAPPSDVCFDGNGVLYGLELVRCTDSPPLPFTPTDESRPLTTLKWDVDKLPEGATLKPGPDGAVSLRVFGAKAEGWGVAELPVGFQEVLLEVEGQPGFGVYLAHRHHGEVAPVTLVRLEPNSEDDNNLSLFGGTDRGGDRRPLGKFPQGAPPSVAPRQWIKLRAGVGAVHWATSHDGVCWATGSAPMRQERTAQLLGIWHSAKAKGELRVRSIRLAALPGLTSLAARLRPLSDASPQAPADGLLPPWEDLQQQGAGALRRLQAGEPWSQDMATLVDAAPRGGAADEVATRRRLLTESSYLIAGAGNSAAQLWLQNQTIDLAWQAWHDDGAGPASFFLDTWSQMSTWLGFPPPSLEQLQQMIRFELQLLVAQSKWDQLSELHGRLKFYRFGDEPLLNWAGAMAQRSVTGGAVGSVAAWQPSWVDQVDKATFNAVAELEGLLQSESWEAAAKLAATASIQGGLAPHPHDEQLLLSFGDRVRLAAAAHPELRAALLADVQPVAQLHIRSAIEDSLPQLVERHAVRFPNTPAAGDAWRWLGDLALADGRWRQAVACYRRAADEDPYAPDTEAKRQLALSLGGRGDPQWKPDGASFRWGSSTMSGEQVQQLVETIRGAHPPAEPPLPAPLSAPLETSPLGKLEQPFGRDPRQQVTRFVNELGVDWCGRQLGWTWVGDRLIVCNRFQLASFGKGDGQRQWQAAPAEDPKLTPARARDLPLTPSRPASNGRQAAARLLYGTSGLLLCADVEGGEVLWMLSPPGGRSWASDPLWHAGRLWVVRAVAPQGLGETRLEMLQLRIEDGQQLAVAEIGRVRARWSERRHCQLAALDRGIIVCLDGAVLRVDPQGVRWIRRHRTLPLDADRRSPLHLVEPPAVSGQRVVVHHPGWPAAQCLDAVTGRKLWERFAPALASVTVVGGQVLARTDEHLECWSLDTGETLWRRPWAQRCLWLQATDREIVCLVRDVERMPVYSTTRPQRAIAVDKQQPTHHLQRRRWSDGGVIESLAVNGLQQKDPRLGPLFRAPGAWWIFAGDGVLDAARTILKIAPAP